MVSILLPALRSARDVAKSTQCLSNLRQIGIGFYTYAANANDHLPPLSEKRPGKDGNGSNPMTNGAHWYELLHTVGGVPDGSDPDITNFKDYNRDVWRCPTVADSDLRWGGGYGVNNRVVRYAWGTRPPHGPSTGAFDGGSPTLVEIKRHSEIYLVGDMGRPYGNDTFNYTTWTRMGTPNWHILLGPGSGSEQPACRHQGGSANVTFVDGHGATRLYDELRTNPNDLFASESF